MRFKNHKKAGPGKVVTGLLLGSAIGAAVGWLTAPASGAEIRRRLTGSQMEARERARTAQGNLESQVRELVEETDRGPGNAGQTIQPRRRTTAGR